MDKKITLIKSLTFFGALFCALNFGFGQTTLSAGDIAITGFNSDNPDQFTFVLLEDVTTGTAIYFTDEGWLSTGDFRGYDAGSPSFYEGYLTWTADANLSCGTEITITDLGSNVYSATSGTVIETDNGFDLSTSGDQILAFQGSTLAPTFIFAVTFDASGWSDLNTSQGCSLPTGLVDTVNAISLYNGITEYDNANYNCTVTSNKSYILAGVSDATNWTASNSPLTLGGCSYTCSSTCASTVTWNGSWSGTPDITTEVIIASNYDTATNGGSFSACSLTVNAGATLTIGNGDYVEVENSVDVDGTISVQTQGAFVQNDSDSAFNLNGAGSSDVYKITAAKQKWYFYTYWSSPVVGETVAGAFPNTESDRRFLFNAANYLDVVGDGIDDNDNDWQIVSGSTTLAPGVGYAATAGPFHIPGGTDSADFIGALNTGNIATSIYYNASNFAESWNFIGNPYAGALDFDAFYAANSSVIEGAAYFWSQATPPTDTNPGNEVLNFSQNDYATYTIGSGGVAGGSPDIPTQYVPSAQGFFVSGLKTGDVTFTNSMRMADGTSNNLFFKSVKSKSKSTTLANKLWLNLTSDNGVFGQVLMAYVDGATSGDDGLAYDAPKLSPNGKFAILYTNMDGSNKKFAIQGKSPSSLTEDEVIKLGFNTSIDVPTIYTLSIAQFQGDFLTGSPIYLKDNLLNKLHDLTTCDYTFTSEVGEFKDRFDIVFTSKTLSTDVFDLDDSAVSIFQIDDTHVRFKAAKNLTIKTIDVFDVLGRQLYQLAGNNNEETYNLSTLNNSIFIAKVKLSNGAVITKKAIKK